MSKPPMDPRAQQALFSAKVDASMDREHSVKGGIYKAAFMIGGPIIVAVVVLWWLFFS